jgi:hypothetical protein
MNGDAGKEQHQRHQARSAHHPNMRPPTTISPPGGVEIPSRYAHRGSSVAICSASAVRAAA